MASKSKATKQPTITVCGNCGIDLCGMRSFKTTHSRTRVVGYRCELCTKVEFQRTENDLISKLELTLVEIQHNYSLPLLIDKARAKGDVTVVYEDGVPKPNISQLVPEDLKMIKYLSAYSNKLITMIKTDLQSLNAPNYKMSRKYLIALSSKIIEEAQELSDKKNMFEDQYINICHNLQQYLNIIDNIFEIKKSMN